MWNILQVMRSKSCGSCSGNRNFIQILRQLSGDSSAADVPKQTIKELHDKLIETMGVPRGYRARSAHQNRTNLLQYLPKSQSELPPRRMKDSFDAAIIPLSTDYDLQNKYVTNLGYIRLGRVLEDMDFFAVWSAMKHLYNPKQPPEQPTPYVVVTLLVDEVVLTQITPKPDKDVKISGQVTWAGSSSIEVTVWLEQLIEGTWQRITCAIFVVVARNSDNTGPAFVNKLLPEGDAEISAFKLAESRARRRKIQQSECLLHKQPTMEEQTLIHDLFKKTIDMSDPMIDKRILPDRCAWLGDTSVTSNIFSHPEDRNFHNKVFGGFLMRQALELGWLAGYLYTKHRPELRYISDITFKQPVEVGSLLRLNGQVVYTDRNYMQIAVHAEVFDPLTSKTTTTNSFHYVFEARDTVKNVMPYTYHGRFMWSNMPHHDFIAAFIGERYNDRTMVISCGEWWICPRRALGNSRLFSNSLNSESKTDNKYQYNKSVKTYLKEISDDRLITIL